MKKLLYFTFFIIGGLLILGIVAYGVWIYNPHTDKLRIDPLAIFAEKPSSVGLLIRNATLIDVEAGSTISNGHILITGDTIAEVFIGEAPEITPETEVFDARGRYIMPGLIDVHVHLATHMHLINGDFSPEDSLVEKAALEQLVRYGVTTVLSLGGGGSNDEQSAAYKRMERNNEIISPWLFASGDIITSPDSHPITTIMGLTANTGPERLHQAGVTVVHEEEDPSSIVANKKRMGLDGVKIILERGPPPWHPNPRMSVKTAGKIVEQAKRHSLPVFAHTQTYKEFADAVQLGVHGVMHGVMDTVIYDEDVIKRMKQKGIWYIPTLSVIYGFQFLEAPERLNDTFLQTGVSRRSIRYHENPLFRFGFSRILKEFDLSEWLETSMNNLSRLHKNGVRVALGTDASTPFNFPGYSAHIEMELLNRTGLSNAEVLRAATLNGASFLGIEDKVGSIASGKIANLLILENNPLLDIRNTRDIHKVILKGQTIDPGF